MKQSPAAAHVSRVVPSQTGPAAVQGASLEQALELVALLDEPVLELSEPELEPVWELTELLALEPVWELSEPLLDAPVEGLLVLDVRLPLVCVVLDEPLGVEAVLPFERVVDVDPVLAVDGVLAVEPWWLEAELDE